MKKLLLTISIFALGSLLFAFENDSEPKDGFSEITFTPFSWSSVALLFSDKSLESLADSLMLHEHTTAGRVASYAERLVSNTEVQVPVELQRDVRFYVDPSCVHSLQERNPAHLNCAGSVSRVWFVLNAGF